MIDGESGKAELLQSSKCSSGNMTAVILTFTWSKSVCVCCREKKLKGRVQELVAALERLTKSSEVRHQQSAEFVNDLKRANRYKHTGTDGSEACTDLKAGFSGAVMFVFVWAAPPAGLTAVCLIQAAQMSPNTINAGIAHGKLLLNMCLHLPGLF